MSNLLDLDELVKVMKKRGLYKLIDEVGYAKYPKKYYVKLVGSNRKISFGHQDYEDYLIHGDKKRRERYRQRHANDNIDDPSKPGFWSYHLLW